MDYVAIVSALDAILFGFRCHFSKRSWPYFPALIKGFLLCMGRKTVSRVIGPSQLKRSTSGFYRFFSAFKGAYEEAARGLLHQAILIFGCERVVLFVDDTLSPKTGPKIFGCSKHCDHHAWPKRWLWGHNWVVVALGIRVPIWKRWISLPLLVKLYIRKKDCTKDQTPFHTKLKIALDMVDFLAEGLDSPLIVVGDGAYTNGAMIRPLRKRNRIFIGRLRADVTLYDFPVTPSKGKRGRRPTYGPELPKLSKARRLQFRTVELEIYSERVRVEMASLTAIWKSAGGAIKVVAVRQKPDADLVYLMSSDPTISDEDLVQMFSGRWSIEMAFRNAKSILGLDEAQVRKEKAVFRLALLGLWAQTLVILTYFKVHGFSMSSTIPVPSWYNSKQEPSFADMLGEVRVALMRERIAAVFGTRSRVVEIVMRHIAPALRAA